jgi:hypothetical protein
MAGSRTLFQNQNRTPGRTPTESGINNGSGTNQFMTANLAVTTSYDLNKNGPLVVILLCNQVNR